MRRALLTILFLPRNLAVLLLVGYRRWISPLYGDVCRYYPSCSAYGLGSVQQRGLVVGGALTFWRILRCNPFSPGGVDEVRPARAGLLRLTPFGFVVPAGTSDAILPPHLHPHSHDGGEAGAARPLVGSPTLSRKD